jgi:FtsZ-binding cell division protein ZapB
MNWEVPTCAICLQDLSNNLTAINCGHIFHNDCILQCLSNKTKNCPLCRIKIIPSRTIQIQFNLTSIIEPPKTLDMTEEDSKNLQALQSKVKELQIKISNLENIIKTQESYIKDISAKLDTEKENFQTTEEKYFKSRDHINELSYNLEKFQDLFKTTHKKLVESQKKVDEYGSIAKMLADIDQNQSYITWAHKVRESSPLEDQASQFYSTVLISSNTIKSQEKEIKSLKAEHNSCSEEISKLKKANAALRKENQNLIKETPPNLSIDLKVSYN